MQAYKHLCIRNFETKESEILNDSTHRRLVNTMMVTPYLVNNYNNILLLLLLSLKPAAVARR